MLSLPQRIVVEFAEMPILKNPSLVCGFPGSGYVGKIAVDYMIEELKAIPFANMLSSSFPPQVLI
ncbi:MAG: PAC2 family protein, partial [Thaumarchaeota archaeon]|nr:PAC2 family protein [Nitrososphaerota archaeon]